LLARHHHAEQARIPHELAFAVIAELDAQLSEVSEFLADLRLS
jgi:hypothetical protein